MNRAAKHGVMAVAALWLWAALPAAAGTVTGVVRNGTTGQPAAGVDVILLELQSGMQDVAQTKTDAQGHFQLSFPQIGQQPMLLRAVYQGVFYHEPVPPGQADANITIDVFEPTADPSAFQVLHHIIAVEPQGSSLMVGEEYDIQNKSTPPKAFYKPGGCFTFTLPKGAELNQVEAWGPSGMPVVQGTVNKGNNRYAIVFPFRPGDNGVRFSYKLDYASQQATLHLASLYPAAAAMLLAPPQVKVIAEGFSPAGSEHGWSVYSRPATKANESMVFSISGTAPPPSADAQDQSGAQSSAGAADGANPVTPVAQALPPRLDSLKWILVAGFASLFLLGALFLWWRARQRGSPAAIAAAPATSSAAAASVSSGREQSLRQSVDEIKESLFRLELRRQAGTVPEEAYQAQRKQLEKALRDLVKG